MLYRDRDSQEGYIHVCDDSYKYTAKALKERLQIYVHDITAYALIGGGLVRLKYCPYCGKELEADERTNEYYKHGA